MFGKEARSFLNELGQRMKMSSGLTASGAANLSSCAKRECCYSARVTRFTCVCFLGGCYFGGCLIVVYCFIIILLLY